MFPSQMVCLKIVSQSNDPFYQCFPRKWYALASFPLQMAHFIHVVKIIFPSNETLYPCFPCKWHNLKSLLPQIAHFIHVSLTNGTP